MKIRTGLVYKITFPDGQFYVGSSIRAARRLGEHRRQLVAGTHCNPRMQRAFDTFGAYEVSSLVEDCDPADMIGFEQLMIDTLRPPLNIAPVAGVVEVTEEGRAKLKAPKSPEHRARISAAAKASWAEGSPARAARVNGMKGVTKSDEHRAKMSEAAMARQTPERRAAHGAKMRGFVHSAETRAKVSAAGIGRVHSPEARAKMSAALKGVPKSPEHRAALSAAHKARRSA